MKCVLARAFVIVAFVLADLSGVGFAYAQGAPEDAAAESAPRERPPSGPAIRERGARRSRGASTASGALFIVVVVAAVGHYVWKKLRR